MQHLKPQDLSQEGNNSAKCLTTHIRSQKRYADSEAIKREAQTTEHLQIVSIDCSPEVLEVVLKFLYTEKTDFGLDVATDVLFAADLLLIEKLKLKAAVVISTLGNGSMSQIPRRLDAADTSPPEQEDLDIYDVVRAGWLTRVPRLEEFGARFGVILSFLNQNLSRKTRCGSDRDLLLLDLFYNFNPWLEEAMLTPNCA